MIETSALASCEPCDSGEVTVRLLCVLACLHATACDRVYGLTDRPVDASSGPWLAGYAYRRQIVIPRSPQADTLEKFTISVALDADNGLRMHAAPSGNGFVFIDGDTQTPLAHEIVSFDPETGALDAWVQLRELGATPATIFLYYGGPLSTTDAREAWSSTYASVWHLDGATPETEADSTTTTTRLSSVSNRQPAVEAAAVGRGRRYDGVDDTLCGVVPSLELGINSFTFSTWVDVDRAIGSWDSPLARGGGIATSPGFTFELGATPWEAEIADGTIKVRLVFGSEPTELVHLAAVVDRNAAIARTYLDGALVDEVAAPLTGSVDNPMEPLCIGNGFLFDGAIDEVRVYRGALGHDWIATEYANVHDRATFMSIGDEEAAP